MSTIGIDYVNWFTLIYQVQQNELRIKLCTYFTINANFKRFLGDG